MHFPCFTCAGSRLFNTVRKFKISKNRPMSLFTLKCLNLLRNGSSRNYALFCGSLLTLLKKMYRDSGRFVFRGVLLVKDRAVY